MKLVCLDAASMSWPREFGDISLRVSLNRELTQDKCYLGGELHVECDDTLTQVRGYPSPEHESVC
jgi:hypothetical protein